MKIIEVHTVIVFDSISSDMVAFEDFYKAMEYIKENKFIYGGKKWAIKDGANIFLLGQKCPLKD